MAMTPRERMLTLLLPAAAVLLLYGVFSAREQITKMLQARRAVDAARAKAPTEQDQQLQQAQVAAVQRELDKENKDLAAVQERWRAAGGKVGTPRSRPERIELLNQLLLKSGLRVIDASDAEGARDARSFPALDVLARDLAELSDNQQPKPRVIRFAGRYADVATALAALARGDAIAVPLGLTMKPNETDSPWREWMLLVWV